MLMPDDELYRRWQVARLTEPLHRLAIRSAAKADFEHDRYDLVQLALRAIDHVVTHQASMSGTVTPDEVIAHLSTLARRMAPDDPGHPWAQVARLTLSNLLNDGRPHRALWTELAVDSEAWAQRDPYSFRLLRLVDAGEEVQLSATNEAIMLYLQALDVDLADREAAAKLILQRQMEAGEFERARRSAVDARRTAEGLAASLRDRLDDTRRDLGSVDWDVDIPQHLQVALSHVTEQLELDRHILTLAEQGVAGGDDRAADACRAVIAEVRRSQDVHTRLERLIVGAIPVYLRAQEAQRFAPRAATLAVDLVADLLRPFLAADPKRADQAALGFAVRIGWSRLAPWTVDGLSAVLLRPPVTYERPDPAWDDPGELEEPDDLALPADVEAAAVTILGACRTVPHRLSELADLAAHHTGDVADAGLLEDVVHLAALSRFVAGGRGSDEDAGSEVGLHVALDGLVAVADGRRLDGPRWAGDDLLVGSAAQLAGPGEMATAISEHPEGALAAAPVAASGEQG
jgi:hypothetical protein